MKCSKISKSRFVEKYSFQFVNVKNKVLILVLFEGHIVLSLYFPSRDHTKVSPSTTY